MSEQTLQYFQASDSEEYQYPVSIDAYSPYSSHSYHPTPQQSPYSNPPYQPACASPSIYPVKSVGVAYLLLILLGGLGAHHFYQRKYFLGILYVLTFGFFLIGVFVDLLTLPGQIRTTNHNISLGLR